MESINNPVSLPAARTRPFQGQKTQDPACRGLVLHSTDPIPAFCPTTRY